MKHKAIMVIALLALVSLMVTPICAYELLAIGNSTQFSSAGYGVSSILKHNDSGDWTNRTLLHYDLIEGYRISAKPYTAEATGSGFEVALCQGGVKYGEGYLSYNVPQTTNAAGGWVEIAMIWDSNPPVPNSNVLFFPGFEDCEGDLGDYWAIRSHFNSAAYPTALHTMYFSQCAGGTVTYGGYAEIETSFTCVPTSQYPDTDVVCTDTSTGFPTEWLWSIDAEALDIHGWQTNASQDYTWQSVYPGFYSVNLWAENPGGGEWYNRSNYVLISVNATPNDCSLPVAEGYIRSMAQCVDTQTSGAIHGCNLQLNDIEGGAWSNVTERFDGTWCIDTLPLHHINAYGQATGYSSASRFNLPVSSSVMYELFMIPGYVTNATEGHVWLYVLANDYDTGAALSGATVLVSGSGEASQTRTTGLSGQVIFEWANASTIYVTVDKSGYSSVSKVGTTSDYGPDTVRVELHRVIVTPTATSTPGPGGVTPAPTLDTRSTTEKDTAMMNQVRDAGPILISLAILATIMGLLKLMAKK